MRAAESVFEQVEHGVEGGAGVGFVAEESRDLKDVAGDGAGGEIVGVAAEFGGDGLGQGFLAANPQFA